MNYPITTASAAILGIWLVWLSVRVIRSRQNDGISLGTGESQVLTRRIRAQGNLSEYAPIALILLFLAEAQNANVWAIGLSAALLVIGRLMHGTSLSFTNGWALGRIGGMVLTFSALALLALTNVWLIAGTIFL